MAQENISQAAHHWPVSCSVIFRCEGLACKPSNLQLKQQGLWDTSAPQVALKRTAHHLAGVVLQVDDGVLGEAAQRAHGLGAQARLHR